MVCFKIGHSYEAFPYLFGRNIPLCLLYANGNSSADLVKYRVIGNLGLPEIHLTQSKEKVKVLNFSLQDLIICPVKVNRLSPRISDIPRLPVTPYFKISTEEFMSEQMVRKCFICMTDFGTIHRGVLPKVFFAKTDHESGITSLYDEDIT